MKEILIAFLISLLLSLICCKIFIPVLKRFKCGQPILSYVKEHYKKSGTPTMGGIIFILVGVICFCFFTKGSNHLAFTILTVTVSFMIVGFIDDVIKIKSSNNQGLTPLKKTLFQLVIALITAGVTYKTGATYAYLPFTNYLLNLGFLSVFINVFIFIATVNSVNLVDGLDGLCASVSLIYLLALTVITLIQLTNNSSVYIDSQEYFNICMFNICISGSVVGYLAFNTSKASVFMGDSGSLALGGVIAGSSIFTLNSLIIPVLGIMFLITSLSVILQVIYFKKTKKRIFLMSPIHHHFQQKGYSESKISYAYSLVTLIMAILLITFILRG